MTSLSSAAVPALHLRPAMGEDARLLFNWVNQPDCLAASLKTLSPIEWAEHLNWFEKRVSSSGCGIWIATFAGKPIGQVRAEVGADDQLHVAIYIAAPARGAGHGSAMLASLATESAARWPGVSLVARVRNGNAPSRKLFEKAGYRLTDANDEYRTYVRAN
jgi:RimJ/RimL family protein N-acetyltransferase